MRLVLDKRGWLSGPEGRTNGLAAKFCCILACGFAVTGPYLCSAPPPEGTLYTIDELCLDERWSFLLGRERALVAVSGGFVYVSSTVVLLEW